MNECQLVGAAGSRAERGGDGAVDDVCVPAAKPRQDRPGDTRASRVVETRIGEREVGQPEGTAEAKSQALEVAESERCRRIRPRTFRRRALENDDRVVVCGGPPHVNGSVTTYVRAIAEPAVRRDDG